MQIKLCNYVYAGVNYWVEVVFKGGTSSFFSDIDNLKSIMHNWSYATKQHCLNAHILDMFILDMFMLDTSTRVKYIVSDNLSACVVEYSS